MRKVRLTSAVKTDSPPICGDVGDELRLPEPYAQFVVNQNLGVYVDAGEKPGPTRAELEAQEKAFEYEHDRLEAVADGAEEPDSEEDEEPEPPKRPYGNAPKSAWVRYAVAVDDALTTERAELMTKADLMGRYGERLLGYYLAPR